MEDIKKIDQVKTMVERLNEFYEEHGRMPAASELDSVFDMNTEHSSELVYEMDE